MQWLGNRGPNGTYWANVIMSDNYTKEKDFPHLSVISLIKLVLYDLKTFPNIH
jgi:hypothetical protein